MGKNLEISEKLENLESSNQTNGVPNKNLEKTREFLMRTQEECKNLEKKLKVQTEKHEEEMKQTNLLKKATEDKYSKIVRERESFKEKEEVFIDVCKALTLSVPGSGSTGITRGGVLSTTLWKTG